jgi:DNA polymerase III subunit epsilon
LVAHFSQIEAAFLDAACRRVYHAPFVAPFICTVQLENRWFPALRQTDALRLGKLRSAYNLPPYAAHDGLIDAIACGELLLAQRARKGAEQVPLANMIRQ